jgi:hypothetical protein
VKYRFRAARTFWRNLGRLSSIQQAAARRMCVIFKQNPFDRRLHTHKIHRLSSLYSRTIYAVEIEADLRAIFYLDGNEVVTVDIGTHDVYRG